MTPDATPRATFRTGLRDGLPFLLVVSPFALLFGVVSAEAGLHVTQTLAFSVAVFAGAAQFTALQLMQDQMPTIVVVVTALAVNLRTAMYSAALTPWLGDAPLRQRALMSYLVTDQSYACADLAFQRNPGWSIRARVAYFLGSTALVYPVWLIATVTGARVGSAIPGWLALDFALPICFLAIIGPMLRTGAHRAAAAVSVVLALALTGVPYSLGLLIAAAAAMATGAAIETWTRRLRPA